MHHVSKSSKGAKMIKGIDISKWDGKFDAAKAKEAGVKFVYIKATGGELFVDVRFQENRAACKAAGLVFGLYHYIVWTTPPVDQVQYFIKAVEGDWGQLPPILDFEERQKDAQGVAHVPTDAASRLWLMLQILRTAYGKNGGIYTGPDYWKNYGNADKAWAQFPLWIAHWRVEKPDVPLPWKSYFMWQTTDKGSGPQYGGESEGMDMDEMPLSDIEFDAAYSPIAPPVHPAICPTCGQAWPVVITPKKYVVIGNPNIRYPNYNSGVITVLMNGTEVIPTGQDSLNGLYTYISSPVIGWVWKQYVKQV
jgi:lysozyme